MVLAETIVDEAFIKEMGKYREKPKGKTLLEACSESVVLFSEYMLGVHLYSWQVYWLHKIQLSIEDRSKGTHDLPREFLAVTSRQIGKSTALAILNLWCCVFNKVSAGIHLNTMAGIISATDVQSRKLLHEMEKLSKQGDKVLERLDAGAFGDKFFTKLLDANAPNNTSTITFKPYKEGMGKYILAKSQSGSDIKSYPPTKSVLGETFSIISEDEAGMTEGMDDEFHYEYAYPTGNSTDAIRLYTSTPWQTAGFFYRLADPNDEFKEHPADRVLFTIEAIKLENPNYYKTVKKTIDTLTGDGKLDEVRRAYYCQFVKGEKSYFVPEAVEECFDETLQEAQYFNGECDLGIDYGGQVTSRTVLTISAMDETGKIYRKYHKAYPVQKDLNLIPDIEGLKRQFNIQRIIPDDCPAGDFLNRLMEEMGWNVNRMNFRQEKVAKYGSFRSKLNHGLIKSYPDSELKTEMLAMEFGQGQQKSIIQHAPGYTDDLIDSFVMSCYFFIEDEDGFDFIDDPDYTYGPKPFQEKDVSDSYYEARF
jgi:hypothetical protein